jgi:hypothetical protein
MHETSRIDNRALNRLVEGSGQQRPITEEPHDEPQIEVIADGTPRRNHPDDRASVGGRLAHTVRRSTPMPPIQKVTIPESFEELQTNVRMMKPDELPVKKAQATLVEPEPTAVPAPDTVDKAAAVVVEGDDGIPIMIEDPEPILADVVEGAGPQPSRRSPWRTFAIGISVGSVVLGGAAAAWLWLL